MPGPRGWGACSREGAWSQGDVCSRGGSAPTRVPGPGGVSAPGFGLVETPPMATGMHSRYSLIWDAHQIRGNVLAFYDN